MLGKNSISGENEINIPTIKRIVSQFSTPDIIRFLILKTFFPASRNHIQPKSFGYQTPHQVFSELVRLSSLI